MKLRHILAIVLAAALASPAGAHVSIDNPDVKGGPFKARFNVPHGCKGSPTTAVRITIPEGIIGIKPMPKPGWTLTMKRAPYAKTYDYFHGMKVSEGVTEVTWSGGQLPDDQMDEFVLALFVTDAFKPGDAIYIPVDQTCVEGSQAWTEVPSAGQNAHDLKAPAPTLRVAPPVTDPAADAHKHH